MRYKIFELDQQIIDSYNSNITCITSLTLNTLDSYETCLDQDYQSVEAAEKDIIENKHRLTSKDLCIIPIISINHAGKIIENE